MITQKIVAAILPVLLCLTTSGCTSREEARQAAAQRFDTYQTAMSEALRPYLFVLQDETSPDDNYEGSNYYVRNYTVTLDDDTDISIILKTRLSSGASGTASITLNHIYAGTESTAAKTYTPVFSALVQATGNDEVTDSLCQEFLQGLPESQEDTGSGRTDECSVSDTSSLYYYDDGEYSWSLSYEGELASASGG